MDGRRRSRTLLTASIVALLAGCSSAATSPPTLEPTPTATTGAAGISPSPSPTPSATPTMAPSPTASPGLRIVEVAGTESCVAIQLGNAMAGPKGAHRYRGAAVHCTGTTGDPRVSGTVTGSWDVDLWGTLQSGAYVASGTTILEAAAGRWEGRTTGVYSSDRGAILVSWYNGTDAFAGLGYFELATGREPMTVRGQIFPGRPPALTGIPQVAGPLPSPNLPAEPTPAPTTTPKPGVFGPVTVTQGASTGYTYADFGARTSGSGDEVLYRDGTWAGYSIVNDPRVSGMFVARSWVMDVWGAARDDPAGYGIQWGSSRLDVAGGRWAGPTSGLYDSKGDVIVTWYAGSGRYAGLSYFDLVSRSDQFGPVEGELTMAEFGLVFPGEPPTP